jgi:hypothetical protein
LIACGLNSNSPTLAHANGWPSSRHGHEGPVV